MKKKFVATLCAFALAFTLPMAAFADGDGETPEPTETPAGSEQPEESNPVDEGEPIDYSFPSSFDEATGTTTIDTEDFFSAYYEDEDKIVDDVLKKITVEGAQGVKVTPGMADIDEGEYTDEAIKAYLDWCDEVYADGGTELFTVTINGDVTAKDHAVVTFQLNADEYGNKVITYFVLHKGDTAPQKKVVRVHADGTVRIWMEDFSIITFMDVTGIEKYENMIEPQDGDLLSPKTGC